jgi:hypothetical protein
LAPLNRGASTAPTFMALTCRWRSRPQHRKRTFFSNHCTSAKGQKRTLARYSIISSARALHCRRHVEAERLGRLQIDVELDFGGLLDRQVAGFLALEKPPGIIDRQARSATRCQRSIRAATSPWPEVC